jgi:hypothetical protein
VRKKEGEAERGVFSGSRREETGREPKFPRIACSFRRSVFVFFCVVFVCVYLWFKDLILLQQTPPGPSRTHVV